MIETAEEVVEAGRGIRFTHKTSDSIPVLDFSPMLSGRSEDRRRLAEEVRIACAEVGFFDLKNHGFPKAIIRRAHEAMQRFFALPLPSRRPTTAADRAVEHGY